MSKKPLLALTAAMLLLAGFFSIGCNEEKQAALLAVATPRAAETIPRIVRGNIQFLDDYSIGVARSQSERKPLMLFFTAHWCRFCNQMAQEAFRQDGVVALSDRFVCVLVDADQEAELCRQFHVRMFPTIIFLSTDAAPLGRVLGKQPSHRLVMEMQSALQSLARRDDWHDATMRR